MRSAIEVEAVTQGGVRVWFGVAGAGICVAVGAQGGVDGSDGLGGIVGGVWFVGVVGWGVKVLDEGVAQDSGGFGFVLGAVLVEQVAQGFTDVDGHKSRESIGGVEWAHGVVPFGG